MASGSAWLKWRSDWEEKRTFGDGEELVSTVCSMNRLQPTRFPRREEFPRNIQPPLGLHPPGHDSAAVGATTGEVHVAVDLNPNKKKNSTTHKRKLTKCDRLQPTAVHLI
ncbi:hypothetical protein OsI_03491 [Oryza sativa Indica Group]|uniref:Uncharacterized protein n=1 Tax=Oryza sativa subsp. indica TaxID=39946 RepID=A2WUD9_ORYSI|nr:hypothetical protein OsI_03491 [Oryza sativa Indica Group]